MKTILFAKITLLYCILIAAPSDADQVISFSHENVLGTSLEINLSCKDAKSAGQFEAMILAEIDRLDGILSSYKADSEFSRWQETINSPVKVSPELFECLEQAQSFRQQTHDAFHPGAGLLIQEWTSAEKANVMPDMDQLARDVIKINQPLWKLNADQQTATKLVGFPVDINALAKGFVIDAAGRAIMGLSHPPSQLTINIGGDLRSWGDPKIKASISDPSQPNKPLQQLEFANRALATSGNYQRGFRVSGSQFSHILDPYTGRPADIAPSVSVIAPTATMADALATAFSVLDTDESIRLADRLENCDCLIVTHAGQLVASQNWNQYVVSNGQETAKTVSPPAASVSKELVVNFEIAKPAQNNRYRRPYVAVWIETPDGIPVRTLVLWLMENRPGPRWHRELSRWYTTDQLRLLIEEKQLIGTISGATRPPGKYKTVWDGKSDGGENCAPGRYCLFIESAREHGTYQLIRYEFEHGGNDFEASPKGNVEINGTSLVYRRLTPKAGK